MSCIPIPVLHVCDNVISKGNAVISEWGGGGGGGGGGIFGTPTLLVESRLE